MKITKVLGVLCLLATGCAIGATVMQNEGKRQTAEQTPKTSPSPLSKQEEIVKAQKLKNDLRAACDQHNVQACEQIGITKKDMEFNDRWQRITDGLKDEEARIKREANERIKEINEAETQRLLQEAEEMVKDPICGASGRYIEQCRQAEADKAKLMKELDPTSNSENSNSENNGSTQR